MFFKPAVLLFLLSGAVYNVLPSSSAIPLPSNPFLESKFRFYVDLLSTVSDQQSSQNVILSPSNVHHFLLVMYLASAGDTRETIRSLLRLPENQTVVREVKATSILSDTESSSDNDYPGSSFFKTSIHLYVSDTLTMKNDTVHWPASSVDLVNTDKALAEINKWVEDQTKGLIKHFIHADDVTPDTKLIPVTTATLKTPWFRWVDNGGTEESDFYLEDGSMVPTTMMSTNGYFKMLTNWRLCTDLVQNIPLLIDVLELPYHEAKVTMFFLKPKSHSVLVMLEKIRTTNLKQLIYRVHNGETLYYKIRIPKFDEETRLKLDPIAKAMGAPNLFGIPGNLSNLLETDDLINIGTGLHVAKLSVDEHGLQAESAAAAPLLDYYPSFPDEHNVFSVDRPFLYFIYSFCTDTMLFAGVFNKPQ